MVKKKEKKNKNKDHFKRPIKYIYHIYMSALNFSKALKTVNKYFQEYGKHYILPISSVILSLTFN